MMKRKSRTLGEWGERALLGRIARAFERQPGHVLLGPGDDAALMRVPQGRLLVASQDDLVEGTHFERTWADPRRLGHKLLAVNVSDLAAMGGAAPLGCMISAGFPAALPRAWCEAFLRGVAEASARLHAPVVGGNLARSDKIFLSLSIFGAADPDRVVRRQGARPGDILMGVGPLGEAAAGLSLLRSRRKIPSWGRPLVRRFWEPEPQMPAARGLAGLATSMMDNSDGLVSSARTLAEASGVGLRLDLARVPISPQLARWCREQGVDARWRMLAGGEDYGLIFTVRPRDVGRALRRAPRAYPLGKVTRSGLDLGAKTAGFEHFK